MDNKFENPIIINGKQFEERPQLRQYINEKIRDKYQVNSPLNKEDFLFIKALLRFSYFQEDIDSIQSIVIVYKTPRSPKIFWGITDGGKKQLNISDPVDQINLKHALIFTYKNSGKTLRVYPVQGKETYTKREGTWEIITQESEGQSKNSQDKPMFIQDSQTKEIIGSLDRPGMSKISKGTQKVVTGKIDIVPLLLLTYNNNKTLKIIQTEKYQKEKNYLTKNGEWIITATGSVLDAETKEEIGTLDQTSFDKVSKRFQDQATFQVKGKLEKWELFIQYRTKALRNIIRPQTVAYARKVRKQYPNWNFSGYQVHHVELLFIEIVENWMLKQKLTWEDLKLSESSKYKLKKQTLAQDFYNYHKQVAKLAYVKKEDNLKEIKPFY
jgi:hypothetical protein